VAEAVLVVVAHPDDEILWLLPALERATLTIATFAYEPWNEPLTRARERVRGEFPRPFEFLPLESARVFRKSDWESRRPTPYGVELLDTCSPVERERYVSNYERLLELLEPHVAASSEIYTHNPWGEYGHEEHVQVWRAVALLAQRHHTTVWVWDGPGDRLLLARGMRLRADHYTPLPSELRSVELARDLDRFRELKRLYLEHGAWTRGPKHEPRAVGRYFEAVRAGTPVLSP
jgi:LmbE family N-acetylglucosaminyl deacetylase